MLTVFVALRKIEQAMGPLEIWPETHKLKEEDGVTADRLLKASRRVGMCVDKGTAVLMNSKTWHRGAGNYSRAIRPVFYFSFLGAGEIPDGPTWTIASELIDKYRLKDLVAPCF